MHRLNQMCVVFVLKGTNFMHRQNISVNLSFKEYIYFTFLFFYSYILYMAWVLHVEKKLKKWRRKIIGFEIEHDMSSLISID